MMAQLSSSDLSGSLAHNIGQQQESEPCYSAEQIEIMPKAVRLSPAHPRQNMPSLRYMGQDHYCQKAAPAKSQKSSHR